MARWLLLILYEAGPVEHQPVLTSTTLHTHYSNIHTHYLHIYTNKIGMYTNNSTVCCIHITN